MKPCAAGLLLLVAATVSLPLAFAGRAEDEIKNLPGLDFTPDFKHYSGA
jgi:hypothetical protein